MAPVVLFMYVKVLTEKVEALATQLYLLKSENRALIANVETYKLEILKNSQELHILKTQ